MAWQTPKTNWGQSGQTVPAATDFNRIEGNTQYLKDEIDSLATDFNRIEGNTQYLKDEIDSLVVELLALYSSLGAIADALDAAQDSGSWTASLYGTDNNNNQYPIGSGTGRWFRVGKTVTLQIAVVANSTTAAGRPVRVSLPPEVNSAYATVLSAHITAMDWSSGQAKFPLSATTATGLPIYLHKSNTYLLSEDVAINDRIYITGTYMIA